MSGKRILYYLSSIAFIVIGAAMPLFSDYIAVQVAEGKLKIERAQSTADSAENDNNLKVILKNPLQYN